MLRSLGLSTDLMIAELGGAIVEQAADHVVVRSPDNPTFWWGNFLAVTETVGVQDVPRWTAAFATAFPHARHVAVAIDGADPAPAPGTLPQAPSWVGAWASAGLAYDPSVALVAADVVPPERPNRDVQLRPVPDEDAAWQQVIELRMAADEAGVAAQNPQRYREFLTRRTATHRAMARAGHGAWFGAWFGDRLMSSMGLYTDGGGTARFQNVDTHPQARRSGLASTLLHHVARWGLDELGASRLVIVADPAGEAIRIYRRIGFTDTELVHQLVRTAS